VSGANGQAHDPVAAAVEAVEATPEVQPMREFKAQIASTGRLGAILLPVDASDGEIAEFCGWVLSAVMNTYRVEREKAPSPRIIIPGPGLRI
jgi:hypothetical protein